MDATSWNRAPSVSNGGTGEQRHINLSPGEMFCGDANFVVSTLLGSCVAVCLWDAHSRRGAINHFLLPHWDYKSKTLRYGDTAIEKMVVELEAMGIPRARMAAQVFGGASVTGASSFDVGEKNAAIALQTLDRARIPVVNHQTGGIRGLKIRFDMATGKVRSKRLAA